MKVDNLGGVEQGEDSQVLALFHGLSEGFDTPQQLHFRPSERIAFGWAGTAEFNRGYFRTKGFHLPTFLDDIPAKTCSQRKHTLGHQTDHSGTGKLWLWSQLKHNCSTSVTENATHGSTLDLEQEKTCLSRERLPKLKQCISSARSVEQVKTELLHSPLGIRALIRGHAMLQVPLLLRLFLYYLSP